MFKYRLGRTLGFQTSVRGHASYTFAESFHGIDHSFLSSALVGRHYDITEAIDEASSQSLASYCRFTSKTCHRAVVEGRVAVKSRDVVQARSECV